LTCDDSRLRFDEDSMLIFSPNPGYWVDNDTIKVDLISANDILGAPLSNPFGFILYTDFTTPYSELVQPAQNDWIQDLETPIRLNFSDNVAGIRIDSCYLEIAGVTFDFEDIIVEISPDNRDGTVIAYPFAEGIQFNPGDTVIIRCNLCDDPDTCDPNCSEMTYRIIFEPMATCQIYPNPFSPNSDGINDFVVFDYPRMFVESAKLQIFDIHNRPVYTNNIGPIGDGSFDLHSWEGTDNKGKLLPQGLYIYLISNSSRILCSGTVIVVR